jgi:hypothetical protein
VPHVAVPILVEQAAEVSAATWRRRDEESRLWDVRGWLVYRHVSTLNRLLKRTSTPA